MSGSRLALLLAGLLCLVATLSVRWQQQHQTGSSTESLRIGFPDPWLQYERVSGTNEAIRSTTCRIDLVSWSVLIGVAGIGLLVLSVRSGRRRSPHHAEEGQDVG